MSLDARIVLGTGFDWRDLIAYSVGGAAILLLEQAAMVSARLSLWRGY